MKSLLEIQQELHGLENELDAMKQKAAELYDAVGELLNKGEEEFDFRQIGLLAKKIPFKSHPLGDGKYALIARDYLKLLLSVVALDAGAEVNQSRLVFLEWMRQQAGISQTLEELFTSARTMEEKELIEATNQIPEELTDLFAIDALLAANIGGTASEGVCQYLAKLFALLGIERDNAQDAAKTAKCILTKNVPKADEEAVLKNLFLGSGYLDEIVIRNLLVSHAVFFDVSTVEAGTYVPPMLEALSSGSEGSYKIIRYDGMDMRTLRYEYYGQKLPLEVEKQLTERFGKPIAAAKFICERYSGFSGKQTGYVCVYIVSPVEGDVLNDGSRFIVTELPEAYHELLWQCFDAAPKARAKDFLGYGEMKSTVKNRRGLFDF